MEFLPLKKIGGFTVYKSGLPTCKLHTDDYLLCWHNMRLCTISAQDLTPFTVALHYNPNDFVKMQMSKELKAKYPGYILLTYRGETYTSMVSLERDTMLICEDGQRILEITLTQAKQLFDFFMGVKFDSSRA